MLLKSSMTLLDKIVEFCPSLGPFNWTPVDCSGKLREGLFNSVVLLAARIASNPRQFNLSTRQTVHMYGLMKFDNVIYQ
jgi:hypothetical protein